MPLENWFPSPVFFDFASEDLKKEIEKEYKNSEKEILNNTMERTWGDNITTNFYEVCSIKKYKLEIFKKFAIDSLNNYMSFLYESPKPIDLKESWFNYSTKNNYQDKHTHPRSDFSGVYYIKTNGEDGSIRFSPPSNSIQELSGARICYSNQYIEYAPQEGKILIFPSWLPHSVTMNHTDNTRISIAFNFLLQ